MTKSAPAWEMTWCGNRVFPLNRGALRLLGRSRRSNPPGSPAILAHPSGARPNPVPASPPTRRSQLKATKKRSQPSQRIDAESRRLMRGPRGNPPWTFPAGKIESGESPEPAAVRETWDETGLRIRAGDVIGSRIHPLTGVPIAYVAATPTSALDVIGGRAAASG